MFQQMMRHFAGKVKAIGGNWYNGPNLDKANELTAKGMKLEDAIKETWTGKRAAEYGFTSAKVLKQEGTPGKYTKLEVLFED